MIRRKDKFIVFVTNVSDFDGIIILPRTILIYLWLTMRISTKLNTERHSVSANNSWINAVSDVVAFCRWNHGCGCVGHDQVEYAS